MFSAEMKKRIADGWLVEDKNPLESFIRNVRGTRRGEVVNNVDDTLSDPEFRNITSLREIALALRRGVHFRFIVGPVLAGEPEVKGEIKGPKGKLRALNRWLCPVIELGLLSTEMIKVGNRYRLQVTGPRSTVESLGDLSVARVR